MLSAPAASWLACGRHALATEDLNQAIGELTPTQKATRAVVYSRFKGVIDSIHE